MDILGVCGILQTAAYPGYLDEFIPAAQASTNWPGQRFAFGNYPTWWRKAEGDISERALRLYLPCLT
jgi:hypothetical protein